MQAFLLFKPASLHNCTFKFMYNKRNNATKQWSPGENSVVLLFGFFVTFVMMVPAERPKITPCSCFPELVVRSFSAGEINLPPPLSDIPGNIYQTCNTLFGATSRHWEGDWKMRQSQDFVRLSLRFLDSWWNTEWCVWYKRFLKKWKVKVHKIFRKLSKLLSL